MGAWGSTVVASNADTYVVNSTSSTCSTDMTIPTWPAQQTKWPHQDGQTTYYARRAEPDVADEADLEQLLDNFLRHLAGIVAVWRVLHELLMEQENERVRTRPPPPRGVPPADLVRSHRRPAPRAPPQNQTPGLIEQAGRLHFYAATRKP